MVAALVPSSWVASKLNTRLDEMQPAPYARVPASAQPVAERLSITAPFGQLPEQYPTDGSFNFVTVTEPRQSALSWWVGRDEVAFQPLTEEDRFGFQTPDQRRVFSLESMRTAGQVAQYVALTRLGFDAQQQTMMITLYIAMDSFGTACNVTGDGAIALIVDKIKNRRR